MAERVREVRTRVGRCSGVSGRRASAGRMPPPSHRCRSSLNGAEAIDRVEVDRQQSLRTGRTRGCRRSCCPGHPCLRVPPGHHVQGVRRRVEVHAVRGVVLLRARAGHARAGRGPRSAPFHVSRQMTPEFVSRPVSLPDGDPPVRRRHVQHRELGRTGHEQAGDLAVPGRLSRPRRRCGCLDVDDVDRLGR